MKLFNYIGEFFLFRWLFGKFKKSTNEHNAHTECLETSIVRDTKSLNDNHNEDIAPINDAIPPISDDLIDRVFSLMFRKTSFKTPEILIKTRA